MNNFLRNLIAVILYSALQGHADSLINWKADGQLSSAQGKQIQLDITGIYNHASFANHMFFAGFRIDAEGNNFPIIARVNHKLTQVKYWPLLEVPSDLFVYQQSLHLVTTEGDVFKLDHDFWQLTELRLPPNSKAIYSDENENLVICYPGSIAKAVVEPSGCRSLKHHWEFEQVWQTVEPTVCKDEAYLLSQKPALQMLRKIDLKTGKIVSARPVIHIPKDLCEL